MAAAVVSTAPASPAMMQVNVPAASWGPARSRCRRTHQMMQGDGARRPQARRRLPGADAPAPVAPVAAVASREQHPHGAATSRRAASPRPPRASRRWAPRRSTPRRGPSACRPSRRCPRAGCRTRRRPRWWRRRARPARCRRRCARARARRRAGQRERAADAHAHRLAAYHAPVLRAVRADRHHVRGRLWARVRRRRRDRRLRPVRPPPQGAGGGARMTLDVDLAGRRPSSRRT